MNTCNVGGSPDGSTSILTLGTIELANGVYYFAPVYPYRDWGGVIEFTSPDIFSRQTPSSHKMTLVLGEGGVTLMTLEKPDGSLERFYLTSQTRDDLRFLCQ